MPDWFDQIDTAIESAGHQTHRLIAADGELLVSERGARIIGCRLSGVDENLFWHGTDMQEAPGSREAAEAFSIAGGDRLWIAPEVGWYWPSIEKAREDPGKFADTPKQIDPGEYLTDSASPVHAQLSTRMKLTDVRDGKSIELAVSRQVRVIDHPFGLPSDIKCASFAITNVLLCRGGDDGAVAGAWDILQVPPTGTLICPTVCAIDSPRSYYDSFGDRHVRVGDRAVRFLVDGKRKIKMGLLAELTTGRMGYYRKLNATTSSLILRQFATMPGEPYADLPIHEDETKRIGGDCLQAYNDDGNAGGFGEMEHHDPAITVGQGPASRAGTSITHILVGPDESVRAYGETLLGAAIAHIR